MVISQLALFVKQLDIMVMMDAMEEGTVLHALQHTKAVMNIANMSEIHVDWIYSGAKMLGDVFSQIYVKDMVISKHMQRRKPVKTLAKTVQIPELLICTMAHISVLFVNTRLL